MSSKSFPEITGETTQEIVNWIKEVTRTRNEDVGDFDNLQNTFMRGRKVGKIPTGPTDTAVTDREGDISWDSEYFYLAILDSGVLKWARLPLTIADPWVEFNQIRPNLLINGCMRVWQAGTSFTSATTPANNDDTFLADEWILLSDGNDIVDVTQSTTVIPTGAYASMKLEVETANKKFGIFKILEAKDAADIIGGTASLSVKLAEGGSNATLDTFKAAIVSWSGTADVVTSDCVSDWGADGVNPTLAANWTYENTPVSLTITDSFQVLKAEGIDIDTASTKNVGVFVWCDNADATVNDNVYISLCKLEKGATATAFQHRPIGEELALCQRYFRPNAQGAVGYVSDSATAIVPVKYNPPMRVAPTITFIDEVRVTSGVSNFTTSGGSIPNTIVTADGGRFSLTGFTGMTPPNTVIVNDGTADRIFQSARL